MRQQDRLTKHVLNLVEIHADALEHLHGLPAEEAMFDAIDLRERAFAQEAFHFVGVANRLAFFEQRIGVGESRLRRDETHSPKQQP